MRNDIGVFNSQSYINQEIRDVRNSKPFRQPVRTNVTRFDLELLADFIAAKYQIALFHGNPVVIRTCEENLKAVAEWASNMADAKAGM